MKIFELPQANQSKDKCKHCKHLVKHQYSPKHVYYGKIRSNRTQNGYKKIKKNNEACIAFEKNIDMKLQNVLNSLDKAHSKYEGIVGDAEQCLSEYIGFDFSICWQYGDGFVIVCEDDDIDAPARNGRLDACVSIIKENGELTYDDILKTSI